MLPDGPLEYREYSCAALSCCYRRIQLIPSLSKVTRHSIVTAARKGLFYPEPVYFRPVIVAHRLSAITAGALSAGPCHVCPILTGSSHRGAGVTSRRADVSLTSLPSCGRFASAGRSHAPLVQYDPIAREYNKPSFSSPTNQFVPSFYR